MEFLLAVIGLLDATIVAMMGVELLAFFLVGSLILACVGLFLLLSRAAQGKRQEK